MNIREEFEAAKAEFEEKVTAAVSASPGGQVRIINEMLVPYVGQVGTIKMTYYDVAHTGDSPDLHYVEMPDGNMIRVLSTSVEPVPEAV
jgi:hypothetical protein